MIEKLNEEFKNMEVGNKRKILLDEMLDIILFIEKLCSKKKIDINKLKSSYIIVKKNELMDKDFLDLMFIYIFYLKEDLGLLLKDL